MSRFKLTAEEQSRLIDMDKQGISRREMADELDIAKDTIYRYLRRFR